MPTGVAVAQVGHDPAKTPYSDVRRGVYILPSIGQFFGNGGDAGVAPHDGPVAGLRMSFLANKTVQINGGMFFGQLGRLVYDPAQPTGQRFTGPVDDEVIWLDAAIHFNLMGGKTWHRLAPFVGSGIGMAIVEDVPGANFNMGTKFTFSPLVGARFFLSRRARAQFRKPLPVLEHQVHRELRAGGHIQQRVVGHALDQPRPGDRVALLDGLTGRRTDGL